MATHGALVLRPADGKEGQEDEARAEWRSQPAKTYWQQDDAQVITEPHNQLSRRISHAAEGMARHGTVKGVFFISTGPPPKKKN